MSQNSGKQDDFEIKRIDYKEEQIDSSQINEFNSKIETMFREQSEDQKLFEQKLKEAVKVMNEEINLYKNALANMQSTYLKLLEETRSEEEKEFNNKLGEETTHKKLLEIKEKMIELNAKYNIKSNEIKNQIESAAKKLNFDELKQMKARVNEILKMLRECETIMQRNVTKGEEAVIKQKELNQELGYALSKKSLISKIKEDINESIRNEKSDKIEELYQTNFADFFNCDLEPTDWLLIVQVLLNNIDTHCSLLIIEIIIDSLEKFSETQGNTQLNQHSLTILQQINSKLTKFISSPLAIHSPNCVTAYRIAQTIYAEYTTASPTVPSTFSL